MDDEIVEKETTPSGDENAREKSNTGRETENTAREAENTYREIDLARRLDRQMKLTAFLSICIILCSIVVVVQYRQTRVQRAENSIILREINSCTEPGGECYEAGKRSQMLLENESRQVIEHRDRNEELHDVICRREDEIAEAVGAAPLTVKCPPKITVHTDSE